MNRYYELVNGIERTGSVTITEEGFKPEANAKVIGPGA
jgi:hypothetical protein